MHAAPAGRRQRHDDACAASLQLAMGQRRARGNWRTMRSITDADSLRQDIGVDSLSRLFPLTGAMKPQLAWTRQSVKRPKPTRSVGRGFARVSYRLSTAP
jgi:hypothetical protein